VCCHLGLEREENGALEVRRGSELGFVVEVVTWADSYGSDDVFSTRVSMDTIFHSHNSTSSRTSNYDKVDVLLTGFEDGTVYIRIFNCFDIGKIDVSSSLPSDIKTCKVVQHIAHSLSPTHALILKTTTEKNDDQLHIVALDLNFIPQTSPYYLSTLATKSTQLLNLLRYLTQTSTHLSIELRGAFDLPAKFIRNINETLAQSPDGPTNFVTAAYQLVVTGRCSDEFQDWLVDEVGERNLKRWEKASTLGMENIRKFVHENLLPALERCQVVLSRLQGLSKFAKSAQVLGLDTQSLDRVMDTVDCLNLLGHYLMKTVGKEIKQFAAFIKWLRLELEIQGLEKENAGGPGSERLDEACMRRDELNVRTVLDYIRGVMGKSGMVAFLRPAVDARGSALDGPSYDWSQNQADVGFYEVFKKMLKTQPGAGKRPDLDDLLRRLTSQAEKVFDGIAQTLRKSILHSRVCTLRSDCLADSMTARMILNAAGEYELVIATKTRTAAEQVALHRVRWSTAQRGQVPEVRDVTIPSNETIQDIKFVDDSDVMALCSATEQAHLHTLNYTAPGAEWQERHSFDLSDGVKAPSELEVNGRKGRRAVCVLEDELRFTVYDLDSGQAEGEMSALEEEVLPTE
jgi:anaphase-promoting complex subunit 4